MTMEGRVDAVTAAVSSLGSCTATTSLTLKQLLSAVPLDEATTTKNASRDPRKPARGGQAKANSKTPRPKPVASDVSTPAQLSTKAQADLAVHVFNTGLKTLSEAVKSGMHVPDDGRSGSSQDSSTPPTSSPAKKSSLALSPRKPQALNRQQPLSPAGKQQNRRPATEKGPTTQSMPLLALVDCMRTSSAALARFDAAGDLRLGRLQLEKGMSSFVAKLIALGLLVQAREELKTLKARLECLRNPLAAKTSRGPTQNIDYAAILDFDHVLPLSDDALALAIASQMHCLRILAKDSGRPSRVSCILPILRPTSDSSPLRLILRLAAESTASSARAAKHLHELCDILISLAPGTSRATDAVASDPAVSARPHVAMELQALGLRARAHALRLLGKENALASDILDPLAKCLRAFARRNTSNDGTAYDLAVRMYEDILRIFGISDAAGCPPTSQSLYLAFAALAEQGRRTGDARQWLQRVQATLDSQSDAVRQFSVSAQLLRLDLKASDSLLANQVLERMKGPLRGSMQDVDELLGSVSTLIKDIYGCLVDQGNNGKPTLKSTLPDDTQQLLKSIVFQGPRFSARWLGKAPGPDSGDKDGQRWQERKQTLMGSMHQTIRAVLTLLSLSLRRPGMSLNDLDGVLQDCMALLTLVGEAVAPNGRSYYVTISGLYFAFCRQSCQKPSSLDADELRALRKSVECLGTRPVQDKDAGDFVWKSEVLAEAYRAAGRTADVARCLRSVLSYMDERGVLQEIVSCLDSQPPSLVWAATEDRKAASRTVQNVAKIGGDILAVTESLPEPQRLAVLERGLSFCIDQARTKDKGIPEDLVKALLQGYVPSRYPIRRLRVLLYSLPSLCQKAGALALYTEDVRATMASIDADTLGDDTGLRPYIRHFKALIESISEFLTASGESVATSKSVAVWDSMLNSEADLYTHVDDPHFLLSYLRSLADYLATVGKSSHVVEILELASRLAKKLDTQDSDTTAVDLALATELLAAGKFERSEQLLVGAENRVEQDPTDAGNPARLNLRLTQAECSLVSRDLDNAERRLAMIRTEWIDRQRWSPRRCCMLSRAHLLYAMISLGRGNVSNALRYARESAQLPYSELSRIDSRLRERLSKGDSNGGPGGRPSPSDAAGGAGASDEQYKTEGCDSSTILGPHAWLLARAAFRSLCQLSAIYAHLGVFSETLYYAEQAQVIATTMAAPLLLAQANSWLSTVWLRASMNLKSLHAGPNLEKARELAASVRPALASDDGDGSGHLEQTYLTAQLACRMSRVFLELEDYAAAENLVSVAESTLEAIISGRDQGRGRTLHVEDSEVNVKAVEVKMQRLRLTGKATATTEADVKTADVKMQRLRTKGKATTTTRANVETAEVKMPELRLNGRATKTKAASRAATKPTRRTAPARTSGTASATEVEQTLPAKTRAPRLDSKPALLLRSAIEIQKARIQVKRKEWACAAAVFEKAGGTLGPSIDLDGHVTAALSLVGQAMELVTQDPVFSVLQDSTLSFPAITSHGKMEGSSMSTSVKRSPQKGSRSVPVLDDASSSDVFSLLCRAQTHLLEAQSVANVTGDSRSVQKICGLLQNTVILLSAAKDRLPEGATTYGHATYSTEMARNVTWRRERKAALADRSLKSEDAGQWPAPLPTPENRRASFGTATDLAHFQHDYVDIVPASWTVVSLSLSDDRRDLCIARLRPHAVPFVVRLPFERASLNSQHDSAGGDQDDDDGHFSFARGRDELLDIVRRSDALCHDKRDFSVRGARSAWWAERTDLDARLGAFLRRVESVWLGGFRGVLSSSTYRFPEGSGQAEELLMRFGNAFTANVLNKFLPSRRVVPSRSRPPHAATKGSKPAAATTSGPANRVALDASVLELFVNLGDPRQSVHGYDDEEETEGGDGDGDLEDLIGDLLYFVVDVLQLNGERNAYDEIDFDAMVIATMDCLAAYHQEAKEAATLRGTGAQQQHGATQAHTILVLDQALQMFPWEALPCLKDTAVSRVPSLACLRRLVLAQQQQKHQLNVIPSTAAEDGTTTAPNSTINLDKTAGRGPLSPFGHHLSPTSGTLILNPGGDLVNTQKTFEKPLCSTLSPQTTTGKQHAGEGWTHIVARAPSEAEFAAAAAEKDVLLYIGHGSGAQYIRDKTIRRLASASSSMSSTAADDKASTEDTVSAANSTAGCRATVLLFGCTSGALVEHGDFEVSGPARSYMLAGAPCVLGTLWEVTDRDIDRFASSMLEDWGLVPRGTLTSAWTSGNTAAAAEGRSNGVVAKARGKAGARRGNVGYGSDGEARVSGMVDEPLRSRRAKMSLQQAVVRARDAVRFRYLTAGAVVVYGIPVYVKDN